MDPSRIDLLFERFVSKERNEAPDIDVDFEHERREEVLQYLYEKYGRERAGMTAEIITYRPRSAVRDVGKALGLSLDRVDAIAKTLEHHNHDVDKLPERFREAGIDPDAFVARQLVTLTQQLVGFPRHLSQHVGGMVITNGALCELVPIENAAMADRTVVQWDKDDLDALGILKVDVLALGMLTAIRKCFDLIAAVSRVELARRASEGPPRWRSRANQTHAGHDPSRRPRGLRNDPAGRHGWRLSDREPGADEHVAAAQAVLLLRPRDRGRHRAARSDPGGHGASLPAPPLRTGEGGVSQ